MSIGVVVALVDKLIAQQRHADALPLLESALSHLALHPRCDKISVAAAAATLRDDLRLKYARCLFDLQRHEAALFVIESGAVAYEEEVSGSAAAFTTNSSAAAGASSSSAIVGALDAAPPRIFVEGGREAVARRLSPLAIRTALDSALALHDWQRTKLYAQALLHAEPGSTAALCALGRLACASSAPLDAAEYLTRALRADPYCSTALDMLVDHWLLPTAEIEQLVLSLDFSVGAVAASVAASAAGSQGTAAAAAGATADGAGGVGGALAACGELVRRMYLARIPDASVVLTTSGSGGGEEKEEDDETQQDSDCVRDIPPWLRNYHDAVVLLEANDLDGALRRSSAALAGTPLRQHVACLHLSILTQMHETAGLFRFAHALSEAFPASAVAFYAAGCYYYAIGNFERAGRLFSRATDLDSLFAEAWIAYGHCYARLEEGEQALSAYRRAQNLFPGLRHCDLFLGIQYARQHSAPLAEASLTSAMNTSSTAVRMRSERGLAFAARNSHHSDGAAAAAAAASGGKRSGNGIVSPTAISSGASSFDALSLNEMAVLCFRARDYNHALSFLMRAREALPNKERPADHEMCVLFNLASVFRKVQVYDLAAQTYLDFIRLRPQAAVGHCAYGFTLHIQGDLDGAIAAYRTALSLRRDAFCRDLLERALEERHGLGYLGGASGSIDKWLRPTTAAAQQQQQQHHQHEHTTMSWPDQSAVRGGGGATTQQQQMFGDISLGSAHAPSPIPAALQQQLESLRGPRASSTASAQSILGLGGGGGGHGTSVLDQGALLLPPVVHMPIGGDSASQLHNSSTAGGAAAAASSGQQQQGSPVNRPTISRALSFQ